MLHDLPCAAIRRGGFGSFPNEATIPEIFARGKTGGSEEDLALVYARIFTDWLELEIHTDGQWRTLIALASYANADGRAFPGQRLIAARAKLSQTTVARALKYFEKLGILVTSKQDRKRSEYWLRVNQPNDSVSESSRAVQAESSRETHVQTNNRLITDQEGAFKNPKVTEAMLAEWRSRKQAFTDRIVEATKKGIA